LVRVAYAALEQCVGKDVPDCPRDAEDRIGWRCALSVTHRR